MGFLRKLLYLLLPIVLILGGGELFLRSTMARFTKPLKKEQAINPGEWLFSYNDLKFRTEDGVELHGWLIHGKTGYPAFVIAHPYGSERSEILARLETLVTKLNKEGYFIFLFDFRGHGESEATSGMGFRESKDLTAALRAVLKYRNVERRVAVLGIGMGAIAAVKACPQVEEVKFMLLDSLYGDVSERLVDSIRHEWRLPPSMDRVFDRAADWNLREILSIPSTDLRLNDSLPKLYPRTVVFVERTPLSDQAKAFYEATKEPKEILQVKNTATEELLGDEKEQYNNKLWEEFQKYFPAVSNEQTLELKN